MSLPERQSPDWQQKLHYRDSVKTVIEALGWKGRESFWRHFRHTAYLVHDDMTRVQGSVWSDVSKSWNFIPEKEIKEALRQYQNNCSTLFDTGHLKSPLVRSAMERGLYVCRGNWQRSSRQTEHREQAAASEDMHTTPPDEQQDPMKISSILSRTED